MSEGVSTVAWPLGTLGVNLTGSLVLGVLAGWMSTRPSIPTAVSLGLTAGLLGGFTTFSAFSLETVRLIDQAPVLAAAYAAASLLLSVGACWVGLALGRL